jgi:hypothetical protein
LVLGYLGYESLVCRGCGGYLPETTDYDNSGRYISEPPNQCYRCTSVHRMQDDYKDHKHSKALVSWPVHLKE